MIAQSPAEAAHRHVVLVTFLTAAQDGPTTAVLVFWMRLCWREFAIYFRILSVIKSFQSFYLKRSLFLGLKN